MTRYVALLRGINVGGKNLIPMPALKAAFEDAGYAAVSTYIQSGNVLFDATETSNARLASRVEALLSAAFPHYAASVVLRSRAQMRAVVRGAPDGFGADPATYRFDVVFLKPPLTAARAIRDVPIRDGVDEVHAGRGVLYLSRVAARATQSRVNRIASLPIYQQMTIRNWNTTTALRRLLEA